MTRTTFVTAGVGSFDVVMCLGFLYHTLRYVELFAGIRATGAHHLIIDTRVAKSKNPVISVYSNPVEKESMAVEDRFSYGGRTLAGSPSMAALELMLDAYGYDVVHQSDWAKLLGEAADGLAKKYLTGDRRDVAGRPSGVTRLLADRRHEKVRSGIWSRDRTNKAQAMRAWALPGRSPDGIRTRATALRGRRARPLHNGAALSAPRPRGKHADCRETVPGRGLLRSAGVPGLEPRLTEPESVGLPITPYPMGAGKFRQWSRIPNR